MSIKCAVNAILYVLGETVHSEKYGFAAYCKVVPIKVYLLFLCLLFEARYFKVLVMYYFGLGRILKIAQLGPGTLGVNLPVQ